MRRIQHPLRAYAAPIEPRDPKEMAKAALCCTESGYKAIKLCLHNMEMEDDLSLVREVKSGG